MAETFGWIFDGKNGVVMIKTRRGMRKARMRTREELSDWPEEQGTRVTKTICQQSSSRGLARRPRKFDPRRKAIRDVANFLFDIPSVLKLAAWLKSIFSHRQRITRQQLLFIRRGCGGSDSGVVVGSQAGQGDPDICEPRRRQVRSRRKRDA